MPNSALRWTVDSNEIRWCLKRWAHSSGGVKIQRITLFITFRIADGAYMGPLDHGPIRLSSPPNLAKGQNGNQMYWNRRPRA